MLAGVETKPWNPFFCVFGIIIGNMTLEQICNWKKRPYRSEQALLSDDSDLQFLQQREITFQFIVVTCF